MAGGGKGGSQTTEVKIPQWLESAAKQNIARADEIATLGYVPRYGPEVAAFTPMQEAAFANTGQAALSFGLPGGGMTGMEGMPAASEFDGGVRGYSSAPLYGQILSELQRIAPGQYDFIRGMFIDPISGAAPRAPFGSLIQEAPASPASMLPTYRDYGNDNSDPFAGIGGRDSDRGFYSNLNDVSGDSRVSFGDTYLGDVLGFDGSFGNDGPGMRDSITGGRRNAYSGGGGR